MDYNLDSLIRLHQDVYRGRQSWHYAALWQYGEQCLKLDIKCDSYDFQSHLRAFVWSRPKMEWSPVAEIPISQAECRQISPASDFINASDFEQDEQLLLERALMVINRIRHPGRRHGRAVGMALTASLDHATGDFAS